MGRQGLFHNEFGLKLRIDSSAAKFNWLRRRADADGFDVEHMRAAGPFLHARVGFNRETARAVVPAHAEPNGLCIRTVAIGKALAVVVVKCERAVGARVNPHGGWFGGGFRSVL